VPDDLVPVREVLPVLVNPIESVLLMGGCHNYYLINISERFRVQGSKVQGSKVQGSKVQGLPASGGAEGDQGSKVIVN
jgi:hypothetical protein